jgi:hypothetical protein
MLVRAGLADIFRHGIKGMPGFIFFAAAVSCAYFGPFLNNFFVGDDFFSMEGVLQGPRTVLVGYDYNLRIFSNSFWWPLYALFHLDPFGYSLFSLSLYLLNAILLYRLLDRLFADHQLAFLAAGIFVAGGVGADAVLWRAANATLLSTSCYLLTLHSYVLFRQLKQRKYWYLSLVLFLLAINSKEQAASLPVIIVLLEVLIFKERLENRQIINKVVPYVTIVVFYLLANYFIIHHLLHAQSFMAGITKVRPLYSLFAGWTVFFLSPIGRLSMSNPVIYVTAALIPVSYFVVKDKKLLLFGYLWVFFTFLPQSLSSQSQFHGDMLSNSISRQLYLPSIGSSLVFATLLVTLRERLTPRLHLATRFLFLALYIVVQYARVHERGEQWQLEGEYVAHFIYEVQKLLPELPENSYVTVTYPPVGRAFTQSALRVFYGNPKIFWKDSAKELQTLPPGSYGIFIDFHWEDNWDNGKPARAYIVESPLRGS